MALLSPQARCQIRHPNKEPDWSSICNSVFDEYLDTNELFGFGASHKERNSSEDSLNLFDFSGSSEQSHETGITSSTCSLGFSAQQDSVVAAQQPQAKEPLNFWTKTLRALEQNAVEAEKRSRKLRSAKSHPDFLSLGGHPSPPAIPSSPTDQPSFIEQRLPRAAAQSGKRRNVTARSLSRGRPVGVTKSAVGGSVNPHATLRKCSASPPKMMNSSRYRAGFKDAWLEKTAANPQRYELRRPVSPLFCTPPHSAVALQDELATFGFPCAEPSGSVLDDFVSPLTTTFQRTHLHSHIASPDASSSMYAGSAFPDPVPPLPPNAHSTRPKSLNDTAPLYPERTHPLATNKIESFDFGFPATTNYDLWTSTGGIEKMAPLAPMYSTDQVCSADPLSALNPTILPITETIDFNSVCLGISYDPALVPQDPFLHETALQPATTCEEVNTIPYYFASYSHGLPSTPHRRTRSRYRSESPSPPATEPRSLRKASSSRQPSRHRRTKSTNSTPRHPQHTGEGSFVNFTADDSNKILNGVAPSGSSKTKARREKEAADKRRRLSQAAVRAVVEAGGDLNSLSQSGLLN